MKKRLVFFTTLAVLALGLASCSGGKSGGGGKKYTVEITNKEQLAVIMEDDISKAVSVVISDVITYDAYQNGDLVVTSDDESVLTIAGNNKIKPVAAGQTTVRATYKNKFSDSVEVTIKAQQALQEVSNPQENTDYILSMVPKSGTRNYAVGGMDGFYLKSGTKMDDAAVAKVVLKQNATDDYKYSITLTYDEAAGEVTKTIGGCKADGHTNIGYVEDATESKPFATSYFKVNTDNSLSTMIDGEEFWIGTYSTYYTFSFRSASQIQYKAKLYGYMDAIHATSVDINETEVTIPVGGAKKLTATMLPENTTDTINWVSENQQVATIDAATGLLVGVSEGTAKIHANAFKVSDEITITVSGSLNYGTEAEPLTVAQAKTFLDTNFADGTVTVKEMYVTGTVSSATYDSSHKNWTIWLYDGETAQGFELYATSLKDGLDSTKLLDGAIVKAHGYAKLHNGTIYELTNVGSTSYPLVYDLAVPALSGVEVTPESDSVDVAAGAATKQFEAAPLPAAATLGQVSWSIAPADSGATISDAGLVTVQQTAVEEDQTKTFTVTATAGGFQDTATLTVTRSTSGGGEEQDPISLTEQSLLGYSGTNIAYSTDYKNSTVGGVAFTYQQIGAYGSGLQFRNKLSDKNNKTKSNLNNTAAFPAAVSSIAFTWADSKNVQTNSNVLKITFDTVSSFDSASKEVIMLNTTADVKSYTITPVGSGFTFVKIEIDDNFTYSCYWASIVVNF